MSIVLLLRSLNIGGAQRQVVNLAIALNATGAAVTVVTFYDGGALLPELRKAGVRVTTLGKRGRWDLLGFVVRLVQVLRNARPDILYAFLVEPNIVSIVVKPFLRATRVVWGVRASNMDLDLYGWWPRTSFRVSRWLARFADLIIANSWSGAAHHAALGYPASKMAVVSNGIDVERFRPDPVAGRRARVAWNAPSDGAVIGMVGRLDPMKDHLTFLEAAALLAQQRHDLFFVCIGDGPADYRTGLQARASALGLAGRIVWCAEHQDLNAAYNGFDVCCLPSAFGEGFSNVLGEAMACGIACVATDVGDAARLLDGYGEVVPPGDPARLAEGVRRALSDNGVDRRQARRERIVTQFSIAHMIANTEQHIRNCLDARR